jgi:hypothetical protein
MVINGINILLTQAGSSVTPAGNADSVSALKLRQLALADSAGAGSDQAPEQFHSLVNTNYIKEQLDAIMYSFPPYFPAGSPQRIDLIKGVKGVQDEIEKSSLPKEIKEKFAGQKLTDAATDKEISTALEGIKQYKEEHSPAPSPSTQDSQTVNIVSIKI